VIYAPDLLVASLKHFNYRECDKGVWRFSKPQPTFVTGPENNSVLHPFVSCLRCSMSMACGSNETFSISIGLAPQPSNNPKANLARRSVSNATGGSSTTVKPFDRRILRAFIDQVFDDLRW
jgi:hypothetical protein